MKKIIGFTILILLSTVLIVKAKTIAPPSTQNEPLLIDVLQEGETLIIQTTSLGCFHSCKDSYEITLNTGVYSVNCGTKSKNLTTRVVDELRSFESKLYALPNGICTTKDTYTLHYGSKTIEIIDDSCSFNGVHKLMRILACETELHK